MPNDYESDSRKAIERLKKAREQYFLEMAVALEHARMAQAQFAYTTTDAMTRGYFGILNGATGAILQSYAGFIEGFSRAWELMPSKPKPARPKRAARRGRRQP